MFHFPETAKNIGNEEIMVLTHGDAENFYHKKITSHMVNDRLRYYVWYQSEGEYRSNQADIRKDTRRKLEGAVLLH